jgi:hypothetical protein
MSGNAQPAKPIVVHTRHLMRQSNHVSFGTQPRFAFSAEGCRSVSHSTVPYRDRMPRSTFRPARPAIGRDQAGAGNCGFATTVAKTKTGTWLRKDEGVNRSGQPSPDGGAERKRRPAARLQTDPCHHRARRVRYRVLAEGSRILLLAQRPLREVDHERLRLRPRPPRPP